MSPTLEQSLLSSFTDSKNKVIQVFPQLELSEVFVVKAIVEEGEGEEETAEGEVVEAKGPVVIEELGTEELATMIEVLEEPTINLEAHT